MALAGGRVASSSPLSGRAGRWSPAGQRGGSLQQAHLHVQITVPRVSRAPTGRPCVSTVEEHDDAGRAGEKHDGPYVRAHTHIIGQIDPIDLLIFEIVAVILDRPIQVLVPRPGQEMLAVLEDGLPNMCRSVVGPSGWGQLLPFKLGTCIVANQSDKMRSNINYILVLF